MCGNKKTAVMGRAAFDHSGSFKNGFLTSLDVFLFPAVISSIVFCFPKC